MYIFFKLDDIFLISVVISAVADAQIQVAEVTFLKHRFI